MSDEPFVFEIDWAVTALYGRFTTLAGRFTEGTAVVDKLVSIPLNDSTRKTTRVVMLAERPKSTDKVIVNANFEAVDSIQIWGDIRADEIMVPRTATSADPPS